MLAACLSLVSCADVGGVYGGVYGYNGYGCNQPINVYRSPPTCPTYLGTYMQPNCGPTIYLPNAMGISSMGYNNAFGNQYHRRHCW